MNPGLFIFLAVVAIIILICIILIIWQLTRHAINDNTVTIDKTCSATYDCPVGLECEDSRCVIPNNGSCSLFPDRCADGHVCYKGRCVPDLIESSNSEIYLNDEVVVTNFEIIDPNYSVNIVSPFTIVNYTDNKNNVLKFQGNIVDATHDGVSGLWVVTISGDNRITYIYENKMYSRVMNTTILSCLSFDDVCFILCENNVLFIAKFENSNIELQQLEFPSTYNNQTIDSGKGISLGRSIVNTLMIVMTNGIWMYNQNGLVSWIVVDNSNTLYTSFVYGKNLTLYSNNTFKYGTYTDQWNKNNFPHITKDGKIEMVNYWTKDYVITLQ